MIIFDVDGVLADFVLAFTKTAGVPKPWGSVENTAEWSFKGKMPDQLIADTWKVVKSMPNWWCTLPPLVSPEVFESINRLHYDNGVLFVTARVSDHNAQWQTVRWLKGNGIRNPNVIVSHNKGEIAAAVSADFHIDDKPENAACVHWMADERPCRSYFLERALRPCPWLPANVRRVTSVSEYIAAIEEEK